MRECIRVKGERSSESERAGGEWDEREMCLSIKCWAVDAPNLLSSSNCPLMRLIMGTQSRLPSFIPEFQTAKWNQITKYACIPSSFPKRGAKTRAHAHALFGARHAHCMGRLVRSLSPTAPRAECERVSQPRRNVEK